MDRKDFFEFVEMEYGIKPDYPFSDDPDTAVFRHEINRKWFAIVMSIPRAKLGLSGGGSIDIVNLKASPAVIGSVVGDRGFFPAWHMNKDHWLSAALDESADDETLRFITDLSYALTRPRMKKAGK